MRQGRIQCLAWVAIVGALLVSLPVNARAVGRESVGQPRNVRTTQSAKQPDGSSRARRVANTLKQFSGFVSAIDKTSITVERRGKKPETRVFTKLDEMRTSGDVEKDARV